MAADSNTYIDIQVDSICKKYNMDKGHAFELFSMAIILDKTVDDVYNNIQIRGPNNNFGADGGVDGVYFEEMDGNYNMFVFQCKNSSHFTKNEIDKFKNDVYRDFSRGVIDSTSEYLSSKIQEYISITKNENKHINTIHYFVFNGWINDINFTSNNQLYDEYNSINFIIFDRGKLEDKIKYILFNKSNNRKEVKFTYPAVASNISDEDVQTIYSFSISDIKAVNFRIPIIKICELISQEIEINNTTDYLYLDNIRGFLGYNKTNKKIQATLQSSTERLLFPFLNNGLTILCDEFILPKNPQNKQYNIEAKNSVIVNGLQTTKVIYDIYVKNKEILTNIYINVRLYETKDQAVIDKITDATNTQSAINYKDKISTQKFQCLIEKYFNENGIEYVTKRGKFATIDKDTVDSEKVFKFWWATFFEKPEQAKNSISIVLNNIFDAVNNEYDELYKLFSQNLNSNLPLQCYFAYCIMNFVIKKRLNSEVKLGDFVDHSDELFCYGIYKYIFKENIKDLNDNNLDKAYSFVATSINEIVLTEKKRREGLDETYSHSSYFKNAKCKIDYNQKCGFVEKYESELIDNLIKLDVSTYVIRK